MQPNTLNQLRERIEAEHDSLSRRLKEVSDYIKDNPQSMAVDTAAVIAEKAGVHASTLVRFANHFDFHGFSELQKLYKDYIHQNYNDYGERIRLLQHSLGNENVSPTQLLDEFTEANLLSLNDLRNRVDPSLLDSAVDALDKAPAIHVCGIRRAFPVSMYITYALGHMNVKCHPIDGLGMMHDAQANCIASDDVLIAITFSPYSETTQSIIKVAHENKAKIILIAGDENCPSTALADIMFTVQDAEVRSFRSLTSSMCLAQTLCIALGYRREKQLSQQAENLK